MTVFSPRSSADGYGQAQAQFGAAAISSRKSTSCQELDTEVPTDTGEHRRARSDEGLFHPSEPFSPQPQNGSFGYRNSRAARLLTASVEVHLPRRVSSISFLTTRTRRYYFDFAGVQGVRCGGAPIRGAGSSSRMRNTPPSVSILDLAHQRATNALASVASRK